MYYWGKDPWGSYLWGESSDIHEPVVIDVLLHMPTMVAYGGSVLGVKVPFPAVELISTSTPGGILLAKIPCVNVNMVSTRVAGNMDIRLKHVVVHMIGGWIVPGVMDITLPLVQVAITGYGGPTSMVATLWPPDVYIQGSSQVYTTFAISTKDGSVTTYNNFSFNSYFEIDGRFFGVCSSGIYELTGVTDLGVDINARFVTGMTNLGAKMPISPNGLYAHLISNGDVVFKTVIDNITGAPYTMETTYNRLMQRKLNLGKGRIGMKIGLDVESSKPFNIESIKLVGDEKTRMAPGQEAYMNVVLPVVTISTI